ncbi:hypothetical protein [Phenylobacterium sp.]|uniref:hypothetical protein n=1 Tax=Phenylobacterium sp. TaxID=1871053 RepID=UPI002719C533|nr:hypothetical protein [Phenylobacterium sp.]MDO8800445.1 hypothetical protein [Phenylobacterium sp.]
MKTLLLLAASALALTACQRPATLKARLDCPQTEGSLTLVSAAGDGQSCIYRESDGAQITLTRMAVKGSAVATLAALETELKTLGGSPTGASSADTTAAPGAAAEAARIEAEARADAKIDAAVDEALGDRPTLQAKVEDTENGEERTEVDFPGVHIKADGDRANVRVGPIHIDADGDNATATIKLYRDVRLRGEALSREKRGMRATFIYAGDDLSGGYKYLGYEAAGPKTGPIVVAIVKSTAENRHDDMYDDVKKLVRRNGGA